MSRQTPPSSDPKPANHSVEHSPEPTTTTTTDPEPLYAHSLLSPHARPFRHSLLPSLFLPLVYNAALLWLCLSLFLGSLLPHSPTLEVAVRNQDPGAFGGEVVARLGGSGPAGGGVVWRVVEPGVRGEQGSRDLVLEERFWAVVHVSATASARLDEALGMGDPAYDPRGAVTVFFASARSQAVLGVVVPGVRRALDAVLAEVGAESTARVLAGVQGEDELGRVVRCARCLAGPFGVREVDVKAFGPGVVGGMLSTGLIFLLTFTFTVFTLLRGTAEAHGHLLTLRSHLVFRTAASLAAYLFLSLMYTLIALAFGVPMTGRYSQGVGFLVLWMLNWCTMGACGLVMEALFTIVGMKWAVFFLNFWLIVNASGSFASVEVMPGFYRFGYGVPFFHAIQGTRTVAFGTKSRLGVNFGVLVVWMVGGWAGMAVSLVWRIRRGTKTGIHRVP